MTTVANKLRDLMLAGKLDEIALFINRELIPVVKEVRERFNQRHGRTVRYTESKTMDTDDEFVVYAATVATTFTLRPAADSFRTINIKNKGTETVVVTAATDDTVEGAASVNLTAGTGIILVPEQDEDAWHLMASYP